MGSLINALHIADPLSVIDIKPSNILCNSGGRIKICDFGVSGELINSIADTFVGTSTYMSVCTHLSLSSPLSNISCLIVIPTSQQPERIQGAQYTVKSDVWSLGISLIELAHGRFPFSQSMSDDETDSEYETTLAPSRPGSLNLSELPTKQKSKKKDRRKSKGVSLQGGGMTMSILELLQHIVNEPAPRLTPEGRFPKEAEEFVDACLLKDPDARKTPKELLVRYLSYFLIATAHPIIQDFPWIEKARNSTINLEDWASTF